MRSDYDLIVLGGGPTGLRAAIEAGALRKSVLIVEAQPVLGGAGLNTGTIPSKTLRETALYYSGFQQRGLYGVDFSIRREQISVERFMVRKEQVLAAEREAIRRALHDAHVQVVHGRGRFLDPTRIRVATKSDGELDLHAQHVLIATGSSPRHPPGFDFDDPDVVDSDTILDLDRIPDTMTIVGGGVIGCEYASIFAALGVEVTVLDGRDEILGFLDDEITHHLRLGIERLGTRFLLGDDVERVVDEPGHGVGVVTKKGVRIRAGKLLVAAGRVGNSKGLGLESIGVETDARGHILVDKGLRTTVPGVLAAGDVIGFPALASTGMEQGRMAVRCALGADASCELGPNLPYGLYTIPEVGAIGLSEEEARSKGVDFGIGRAWYRENARGQIIGDVHGLLKLVYERKTKRLLGVHIVGEKATELVHIGQAVLDHGGTIDYFTRAVLNFPTLSVLYKRAAFDALGTGA